MATTEANGSKPAKTNLNGKQEVKILMIHGTSNVSSHTSPG